MAKNAFFCREWFEFLVKSLLLCWVIEIKLDKYSIFHQYFSQASFYFWLKFIAQMNFYLQVQQHIRLAYTYLHCLRSLCLSLSFPAHTHTHTHGFVDNVIPSLCECRMCWNNSRSLNVMNSETTRISIWCPFIFCTEMIVTYSPYLPQFNVF